MKKLLKSEIYGSINSTWCTICCRKVNICGYCSLNSTWTVTAFCQNTWKKKKEKKKREQKRKTQTGSKRRHVSKLNHQLVRLATGFDIGIAFDKLDDNHQNLTWWRCGFRGVDIWLAFHIFFFLVSLFFLILIAPFFHFSSSSLQRKFLPIKTQNLRFVEVRGVWGWGGCLWFLGFDGWRSQLWVVIVGVEIGLIWLSVLSFDRLLALGFNWFGWWLSMLRSVRGCNFFFFRIDMAKIG